MKNNFNSRVPKYNDDSDYKTNAPSYYDDLAKKNTLIKLLAEQIGTHLDEATKILDEVIKKIGEGFNQEIYDLLTQWVEDGTLDFIINETLMNEKANKADLKALDTRLTNELTQALNDLNQNQTRFEESINNRINDVEENIGTDINSRVNQLQNDLQRLETETQTSIQDLDNELTKDIDYLFKDPSMYLFNMQLRNQQSDKSFVSVQGSCFLGGSGYDIDYALAFLPTDENYENHGVVIPANSNRLIPQTGGNPLNLHHANGMDYNPEQDSIYVAHANRQSPSGASHVNTISEISKDGSYLKRTISPKGLPSGRRIKYYSYDKKTGKQYVGDDYGVFEVDSDINVLKQIDFSEKYLNYKDWGLAQSTAVHNGYIFLLVGGPFAIAVFDLTGKLLRMVEIPKITADGFYTGSHPQSLFFDNADNLYMVSIGGAISLDLNKFYTRIFRMTPFEGKAQGSFLGSHNTNTSNWIYVTPNPTSPWMDGGSRYPMHSLDEAVIYAKGNQHQKPFQTKIWMLAGTHPAQNMLGNGEYMYIEGENGAKIEGLRLYGLNTTLKNIEIMKGRYRYCLLGSESIIHLEKVTINGKNSVDWGIYLQNGSVLTSSAGDTGKNIMNNLTHGIYATGSRVFGTEFNFGLTNIPTPITLASSSYAPLFTTTTEDPNE